MQGGFISAGAMLFTWIGGQLAKTNWENCYLCYLFAVILLVIEFVWLPKGRLDLKKEKHEKKDPIPKSVIFYTILAFWFGIFIYTFHSNISLLVDIRGFGGTVESSYASICYNLAGMAMGVVTGIVITKLKERIFSYGLVMIILGMLICFFSGQFAILCIGGILCGASFAVVTPAGNYFASTDSTAYNRAFCIALFNAGSASGQFVSSSFYSSVLRFLSIEQRFLGAAVGLMILFVVTLVVVRKFFYNKKPETAMS